MADAPSPQRVTVALRMAFPLLDADEVELLAGRVEERWVDVGRVLVEEGRAPAAAYVLLEGSVRVSHGGRQLASLGAGAVIGAAVQQPGLARVATVQATSRARLLVIPVQGPPEDIACGDTSQCVRPGPSG